MRQLQKSWLHLSLKSKRIHISVRSWSSELRYHWQSLVPSKMPGEVMLESWCYDLGNKQILSSFALVSTFECVSSQWHGSIYIDTTRITANDASSAGWPYARWTCEPAREEPSICFENDGTQLGFQPFHQDGHICSWICWNVYLCVSTISDTHQSPSSPSSPCDSCNLDS